MGELDDVRKRADLVAGWLREAGLKVTPYVNPPLDRDVFGMTLDRNTLRFWPAEATIEVATDKPKRQSVMVVTEDRREISRTYTINNVPGSIQPSREIVFRNFPVFVPRRRFGKFTCRDLTPATLKEERREEDQRREQFGEPPRYYSTHWEVTATIIVPPSETAFLVGYDEQRQFISMLPKRVESVEAAHKALRPAGVPKDALRQGEWFFVPVTQKMKKTLDTYITRHPTQFYMRPLENGSSHWALAVRFQGANYATMLVNDTRQGRHSALLLDGWFKVVRNKEVVPRTEVGRQATRMWD